MQVGPVRLLGLEVSTHPARNLLWATSGESSAQWATENCGLSAQNRFFCE
jgi:hypothetical protein